MPEECYSLSCSECTGSCCWVDPEWNEWNGECYEIINAPAGEDCVDTGGSCKHRFPIELIIVIVVVMCIVNSILWYIYQHNVRFRNFVDKCCIRNILDECSRSIRNEQQTQPVQAAQQIHQQNQVTIQIPQMQHQPNVISKDNHDQNEKNKTQRKEKEEEERRTQQQNVNNQQLPNGWTMSHTNDGRIYYQNNITKSTQWDRPTAPAPAKPIQPLPQPQSQPQSQPQPVVPLQLHEVNNIKECNAVNMADLITNYILPTLNIKHPLNIHKDKVINFMIDNNINGNDFVKMGQTDFGQKLSNHVNPNKNTFYTPSRKLYKLLNNFKFNKIKGIKKPATALNKSWGLNKDIMTIVKDVGADAIAVGNNAANVVQDLAKTAVTQTYHATGTQPQPQPQPQQIAPLHTLNNIKECNVTHMVDLITNHILPTFNKNNPLNENKDKVIRFIIDCNINGNEFLKMKEKDFAKKLAQHHQIHNCYTPARKLYKLLKKFKFKKIKK